MFLQVFRKNKLPRHIETALADYKQLRLYGCMKISCEKCNYFVQVDKHHSTCENERLMNILLPKYKKEVDEIWRETKGAWR